ncbi:exported protein of unknown function [Legionella fallonii LLAP-10]|uniref:Uncharacterized protein n=1 Tax=Legionella fallonii LLAP-10 TaxID=1212491 RepID=A0A098G3L7_9GAMM|nr:exported protein of unknown function [Legionella fallonii LLAP-10]
MVGCIFIVLSLLSIFYSLSSYADLIVDPWSSPGSSSFLSGPAIVLGIVIIAGIIILLLITYYMRRK